MTTERHFATEKDLDEFVDALGKFERGEWAPDQWKAFRLTRGIYGQRQQNTQMVRIKIPQGVLSARQLERLADVAGQYSRGIGHVTTRQNIQIHFVDLANVPTVMERLHDVGLTTREACGNTVRNVVACPFAGVCADAPFDVTPYAEAVTRHFLRNEICQALPRKFKVTVSGCAWDCAQAAINDIALIAKARDSDDGKVERGFEMRVGGGLSTSPENAHKLEDFVSVDELLARAEAVVRVFNRLGNRKNKARARLKYVIRTIGFDAARAEYEAEIRALAANGQLRHAIPEAPADDAPRESGGIVSTDGPLPHFAAWRRTNVRAQKQAGYASVIVRLFRGDITTAQFVALARLCDEFGDGTVRLGIDQNLVVRFVKNENLVAVHRALDAMGLGKGGASTIVDVTSCPGAETCNLAVTASRELARDIGEQLENAGARADLVQLGESMKVKVSGCPNSCGQHHIAGFGFHGVVKKVDGRAVPYYQLHLGGGIEPDRAVFGRQVVKIPARRISEAILRLLALYKEKSAPSESALAFFRGATDDEVRTAVGDIAEVTAENQRPEDFCDLGSDQPFVVEIGEGECAA